MNILDFLCIYFFFKIFSITQPWDFCIEILAYSSTAKYCSSCSIIIQGEIFLIVWSQTTLNHHNPVFGFYWLLKEDIHCIRVSRAYPFRTILQRGPPSVSIITDKHSSRGRLFILAFIIIFWILSAAEVGYFLPSLFGFFVDNLFHHHRWNSDSTVWSS